MLVDEWESLISSLHRKFDYYLVKFILPAKDHLVASIAAANPIT
jgi:hypothetical protein